MIAESFSRLHVTERRLVLQKLALVPVVETPHSHPSTQHEDAKFPPPSSSCPSCESSRKKRHPSVSQRHPPPLPQLQKPLYRIHSPCALSARGAIRVIPHRLQGTYPPPSLYSRPAAFLARFHVSRVGDASQPDWSPELQMDREPGMPFFFPTHRSSFV